MFCQKPLALTADEAAAVVDAARKADLPLGLDLSYRHTQAAVEMKKLISSGRIGHVYAADLTFHNAYGPDKPWFHDPALSGGGCLVDLGVHLVDLALWMLGWPEVVSASARLYARGRPADPAAEVEDHALGHVELASGATARIACSWNLHAGTDAVIECAFYGTEGAVIMRNVDGSFYDFEARVNEGRSSTLLTSPPDAWGGRAIVEWAQRLSADRCFSEDAERYVDVARVLDLLYGRTA